MVPARHHPHVGLVCVLMLMWAVCAPAQTVDFAGGTGEPNDPYQIATAEQFIAMGFDPNLLDKHFVLLCDIDLGSDLLTRHTFTQAVIAPEVVHEGVREAQIEYWEFNGSFDGGGHVISNLVIEGDTSSCVGLFGTVGSRGRIENLAVEGALVRGSYYTGGLVGHNDGTILRCHVSGEVSGDDSVGGLVGRSHGTVAMSHASGTVRGGNKCSYLGGLGGQNYNGIVINCYSDAAVQAESDSDYLGALVGNNGGSIANCYAVGSVSAGGGSTLIGGFVGENSGSIANCYASDNVISGERSNSVGGLVGSNPFGSIANCYAAGCVSAGRDSRNVGGLLGEATLTGSVSHCFWDVETAGVLRSSGGIALATSKMQDASTYLLEGWDWLGERANGTADLWVIPEAGGYPKLAVFCDSCEVHALEGAGTRENPYRLTSPEDIGAVSRHDPSACYQLDADVSMSGIVWTSAPVAGLDGGFEGGGHTVSGLTIRDGGYLGLFAVLTPRAQVANVAIEEVNVAGEGHGTSLGSLAGENLGSITNCRATGVVYGYHTVGGLVGCNYRGRIVNCGAAVDTLGVRYGCGGLVGVNTGTLSCCSATGAVSGVKVMEDMGGLVGYNNYLGHITDCYARGNVSDREYSLHAGGLVGHNLHLLSSCYATGSVVAGTGSIGLGGLVGKDEGGAVDNCYFLRPSSGAGLIGFGEPLSADQMMNQASFVGWDFENVWIICEGRDYPRLRWEEVECGSER